MIPDENNRAPERIVACRDTETDRNYWVRDTGVYITHHYVDEYIRADLYAALEAGNARLTAERDAWQEQASGLATQLTACEAEARHARLVEALNSIANGDGVYGQQAGEYKQIARAALQEDEK